jgi:hypothetical protein
MEIVVTNEWLERPGGTEVYTITMADHLQRLGHEVTLYARRLGPLADRARRSGLRVTSAESDLPASADAVLSQDQVLALELAERFPRTPQAFVAHSEIGTQLPPTLPGVVGAVVVLHDRLRRRVEAMPLDADIVRLRQPVDLQRFSPRRPPSPRPRVALMLGNYLRGARRDLLSEVLDEMGVESRAIGIHGDGMRQDVVDDIDAADFVVGKARVIVEAMACGRPAYVYDWNGSDGWVTPERYELLEADNFGGQAEATAVTAERIRADLAAYDARMGLANHDLAVANHSAMKHAEALVDVMTRLEARRSAPPGPLREMAWLARQNLRLEFAHGTLTGQVQSLHEDVARLTAERDDALQLWRGVQDFRRTRRYRVTQALARPLDALRRATGRS